MPRPALALTASQRPALASRRNCLRLGMLALGGWALPGAAPLHAVQLDLSRLEASMRTRFGEAGVQTLRRWLTLLQTQANQPLGQQLDAVNDFWNRTIMGAEDPILWGQADYWATPLETLGKRAGDCEDYVIGKYISLLRLGVAGERLRFIYVRARSGGVGSTQSIAHMVLGYYETPGGEPQVLDNMTSSIAPAAQRSDLTPVFSFNAEGLWQGTGAHSAGDPVARLSRWRAVLAKARAEGFV